MLKRFVRSSYFAVVSVVGGFVLGLIIGGDPDHMLTPIPAAIFFALLGLSVWGVAEAWKEDK